MKAPSSSLDWTPAPPRDRRQSGAVAIIFGLMVVVLIGFAGLVPELMVELVHAALEGDLPRGRQVQRVIAPLTRLVYSFGEPGCEAHQRLKVCRWLMGKFSGPHVRRPVRPLPPKEVERLGRELEGIGFACPRLGAASEFGAMAPGRTARPAVAAPAGVD